MWVLEKPSREGVALGRPRITQDARQQPRHRFGHHQRSHFAAREHVVPDGQLLVHQVLSHPLIDPFVPAADQDDVRKLRQLAGHVLREAAPGRIQEDHPRVGTAHCLDRGCQGLGFENHPAPASEGRLIGHLVTPARKVAQVVDRDVDKAALPRPPDDGFAERALHHSGEERDDVDLHSSSNPSGGSITIRRSATFTSTTISATAGISRSRSPSAITQRSWPPPPSIPDERAHQPAVPSLDAGALHLPGIEVPLRRGQRQGPVNGE